MCYILFTSVEYVSEQFACILWFLFQGLDGLVGSTGDTGMRGSPGSPGDRGLPGLAGSPGNRVCHSWASLTHVHTNEYVKYHNCGITV